MRSDDSLVLQAQQGSVEAFEQLIERYGRKVHNLAFRMMGNHADAADAAQEALVRVYTRLQHFRGEAAFSTWIYRIVTNACLDELRRHKRRRHASLDEPGLGEGSLLERHLPGHHADPGDCAEAAEIQRGVHAAIGLLREEYRMLIVLKDIQGVSYPELVQITGWPPGTVKSKLHRARIALRQVLEGNARLGRQLA